MLTIAITILISSILRHAVANRTTANDRSVPYASSILRADGPFTPIKNQTTFSACFSRQRTTIFRSPDGWLSKRSRVSDWRTPENGPKSPCLSDHSFSHSPSMAFPLAGYFVSANLLKLRHLRGFSVSRYSPAEKGEKAVSDASPDVYPPIFSV